MPISKFGQHISQRGPNFSFDYLAPHPFDETTVGEPHTTPVTSFSLDSLQIPIQQVEVLKNLLTVLQIDENRITFDKQISVNANPTQRNDVAIKNYVDRLQRRVILLDSVSDTYDAQQRRISNLSDALNNKDAVTLGQLSEKLSGTEASIGSKLASNDSDITLLKTEIQYLKQNLAETQKDYKEQFIIINQEIRRIKNRLST